MTVPPALRALPPVPRAYLNPQPPPDSDPSRPRCFRLLSVAIFLRDVMLVSSLLPPGRGWNVIPSTSVRANGSLRGHGQDGRWSGPLAAVSGGDAGKEDSVEDAEVVLRRAPLFEGLDEDQRADDPAADARRQAVPGRASLPGGAGGRPAVHRAGRQDQAHEAADGRENLISVIGPGEMFGELSMFDPRPRTSSASAVTDATLAALPHDALRGWLLERPDVSMHMLQALARRLRRANDVVADLVFTDVPGRVAKNLLDLAARFGEQERDGLHVHHDLTQEELAQLVGASRETVNKALADFAARGWLQISARSVLILDTERLRKRAR